MPRPSVIQLGNDLWFLDHDKPVSRGLTPSQLWRVINYLSDYMESHEFQFFQHCYWSDFELYEESQLYQPETLIQLSDLALSLLFNSAFQVSRIHSPWTLYA